MEKQKEEHAMVLDYLPNGYPLEGKMIPIAQAIGEVNLTILELAPRKDAVLSVGERVYIGEGKRDKIYYILGRLNKEKLSESAKERLSEFIEEYVKKNEKKYVEFFNKSSAINKRVHQIELLPGFGKKHMKEILMSREEKEFDNFEDMKKRIQNLPDPEKALSKRIFQELTTFERYRLFV